MPVFHSVEQALYYGYLHEVLPPGSESPTHQVIRTLLREAGKLPEQQERSETAPDFRGMTRDEIRAQCANVRQAVSRHCAPPERAAILVRYSGTSDQAEGARQLREYLGPRLTIRSEDAQMQMVWAAHTTKRISQAQIADQAGVSQPTVSRNIREIARTAAKLRRLGVARLEPIFERAGLIPEEVPA